MEWLFWGWFRCFIQYAFYQVIAAAVVFIIGISCSRFAPPARGTLSTVQLIAWFSGPLHYVSCFDLCPPQSASTDQPHRSAVTAGGSSVGHH